MRTTIESESTLEISHHSNSWVPFSEAMLVYGDFREAANLATQGRFAEAIWQAGNARIMKAGNMNGFRFRVKVKTTEYHSIGPWSEITENGW